MGISSLEVFSAVTGITLEQTVKFLFCIKGNSLEINFWCISSFKESKFDRLFQSYTSYAWKGLQGWNHHYGLWAFFWPFTFQFLSPKKSSWGPEIDDDDDDDDDYHDHDDDRSIPSGQGHIKMVMVISS